MPGDPSGFAGPGGINLVAYRGVNNHILGPHWAEAPAAWTQGE